MPVATAALALLFSASTPEAAAILVPRADAEVLTTASDAYSRMTVPITIGERGPFRFLIDTGAQTTVLSDNTVAALGLQPSSSARVMGVAGTRRVDMVAVRSLRMGRRNWQSKGLPVLAETDMGAQGIVGLDGLQGQRVVLDFAQDRIALADAEGKLVDKTGGEGNFDIVVLARRQHGELILTDAMLDGVKVDVVIDTGSDTSIGNRALQRALAQTHPTMSANLRSVTGQDITADMGLVHLFKVDRIRIANVAIAYTDSPTFRALRLDRRPALLLGMHALRLFKRVAIDFASRKVSFEMPPGV